MSESEYSIAIVGMAGKFPCAENIQEFWENIKDAKDCITREPEMDQDGYVAAYGKLKDIDKFDAAFFKMTEVEAADTDPEQRIMMELTHQALENAGCNYLTYSGKIGSYISFDNGVYVWNYIMQDAENWYERYQLYKAYIATRCEKIAYKFGFEGPAIMSEYACASSLNTVHEACQALLNYECDIALAGGVTAEPEQNGYPDYLTTESKKGQIRPFDAAADGLVPGSAAGLVVLKRYQEAVEENDTIFAIIKGTYINNDGNRKAGFAAPSVFGQKECLENVLAVSEVNVEDIDYYEAHGTATELGDAIELRAIKEVMKQRPENNKMYLGSLKSNIGHTNMAAGVANVIKTALMMYYKTFVPTIHYENPCSELVEKDCPIEVCTKQVEWKKEKPILAVCSAVGMGGANAMAVLQEYKEERKKMDPEQSQVFIISGKTEKAAKIIVNEIEEYIEKNSNIRLTDAAYTLQRGRCEFDYRTFMIVDKNANKVFSKRKIVLKEEDKKRIVFVFSGVGNFEKTIGKELYETNKIFRKYMDQCFACCEEKGVTGAKEYFLNFQPKRKLEKELDNEMGIQIIFSLGYSLAKMAMECGIEPELVIGHSNGEYVAAVISGILSLEDAIYLLINRTKLIETLPKGRMINIAENVKTIEKLLLDGISIGAVNASNRTMVTGEKESMDQFEKILNENGFKYSDMNVTRASHCQMMEEIAEEYKNLLNRVTFHEPKIDIISSCIPSFSTNKTDMQKAEYWIQQMCEPIMFEKAINRIKEQKASIFLEFSTGDALTAMIRKDQLEETNSMAFACFDSPVAKNSRNGFLSFLGNLWCRGQQINWDKLYEEQPHKIPLSNYPFEHKTYWKYVSKLKLQKEIQENKGIEEAQERIEIQKIFKQKEKISKEIKQQFFEQQDIQLLKEVPQYEQDANWLTAACIMDYFKENKEFSIKTYYTRQKLAHLMEVVEEYIPFLNYFIDFLKTYQYVEEDYGILHFKEEADHLQNKYEVLEVCKKKHPNCYAYMEFCVYASEYYKEVFQGRKRGSSVIYHDGQFDFMNSFDARMPKCSYTQQSKKAVAEILHKVIRASENPLRILEIGAGSGQLTDVVLNKIGSCEFEYYFTDIKKSLVEERKRKDEENNEKRLKYRVLDITKSPEEQEFKEKQFDIILLFDVIQATPDIEVALKNIYSLLSENGMLSFVQTCDGSELLNMIFGYAPGWWNYSKDPMRERITMPPQKWREILELCNFQETYSLPEDGQSDSYVFLARPKRNVPKNMEDKEHQFQKKTEQLAITVIKEVLGYDVSPEDDLYELGMDSLMAMMIASKLKTASGIEIDLSDMYDLSTVKEISDFLEQHEKRKEENELEEAKEPEKSIEDLLDEL